MKYEIVASRIKEAMNDMHMSAAELSRRSGIGKAAISHYVNGSHCPHNDNAVALAKVLYVDPTWLMGFDVEKHSSNNNELKLTEQEKELIKRFRESSLQDAILKLLNM